MNLRINRKYVVTYLYPVTFICGVEFSGIVEEEKQFVYVKYFEKCKIDEFE